MKHPESFENGRYTVISQLGEGGMAFVYLAVDTRLQRAVAIKVPRPNLVDKDRIISRFAQETVTMARATHPHVVTLYEAGAERLPDGVRTPYLVMELVGGVSAEDIFRPTRKSRFGPLPPRLAARVILAVLSALADLHAGGLIHRDIKPSNIMVGWNPDVVKLMDFGIARIVQDALDDGDRQTKTSVVMFSMGYSAPEQQLSAKGADARADLYAVGATLYALLTGREPQDLHNQDMEDEEFQSVPECLRALVHGATRYKPGDRAYQTARQMAEAVARAVAGEPELDEIPFRAWLAQRREESGVEQALRRAFGHGYTLVPDAAESVAAGLTRWFEEPAESRPAESSAPVAATRRSRVPFALGTALVAVASLVVSVWAWRSPGESGVELPPPRENTVVSVTPADPAPAEPTPAVATDPAKDPVPPVQPPRAKEGAKAAKADRVVAVTPAVVPEPTSVDPEPTPVPEPPRGTVRLAGGADALSLVGADGTSYPAGRVPPGTYTLRATFATKGVAPNAGTVTVAAGQTVNVSCNETFKLCNAQ